MQSTLAVVSAFSSKLTQTKADPDRTPSAPDAVTQAEPSILLIGRQTSWASSLSKVFEEFDIGPLAVSPLVLIAKM